MRRAPGGRPRKNALALEDGAGRRERCVAQGVTRLILTGVAGCALLMVALCAPGCASGAPTSASTRVAQTRVICFGDSITYATDPRNGLYDGTRWTDRLAAMSPHLTTINAGRDWRAVSGPTTMQDLRQTLLHHHQARILVIALGTNDLIAAPPDGSHRATVAMAQAIRVAREVAPHMQIVVCSPPGIRVDQLSRMHVEECAFGAHTAEALAEIAALYRELARREGVRFIDLQHAVAPDQFLDGVHPSPQGHVGIAHAVWAGIRDMVEPSSVLVMEPTRASLLEASHKTGARAP